MSVPLPQENQWKLDKFTYRLAAKSGMYRKCDFFNIQKIQNIIYGHLYSDFKDIPQKVLKGQRHVERLEDEHTNDKLGCELEQ